jgi:hypothetical protein
MQRSAIALFADSLTTSIYGHSFVRTGGTLYATPKIQSSAAEPPNHTLMENASHRPSAPKISHCA